MRERRTARTCHANHGEVSHRESNERRRACHVRFQAGMDSHHIDAENGHKQQHALDGRDRELRQSQ